MASRSNDWRGRTPQEFQTSLTDTASVACLLEGRAGHEGQKRAIDQLATESSLTSGQVRSMSSGSSAMKHRKITDLVQEAQSKGGADAVVIKAFQVAATTRENACWRGLFEELVSRGLMPRLGDGKVDRPALAWLMFTELLPEREVPFNGVMIPGRDSFATMFNVSLGGRQVDTVAIRLFGSLPAALLRPVGLQTRQLCAVIWGKYIDAR